MRIKVLNKICVIVTIIVALPTIVGMVLDAGYFLQNLENEVNLTIETSSGHEGILRILPSGYKVQERGVEVDHTVEVGSHLNVWFNDEWIAGHIEFSSQYQRLVFIADNGGAFVILTDGMKVQYQG